MSEITVIIPILEVDEAKCDLLKKAIDSARPAESIIVVGSGEAIKSAKAADKVKKGTKSNVVFLENTGDTSYPAQVNLAVAEVKTKYFSVLEWDDVYTNIWFKNVEDYVTSDNDKIFAYLPLTEVIDDVTKETIGYANEAFWASSFSEEIGCPDLQCMEGYLNFNVSGAVFKKDDFVTLGGLKESMKLIFWYEFMLRALYKQKKMYVIPKVGYIHYVNKEGSLTSTYAATMSEKEADWWYNLASKEYFFKKDNLKTYSD